MRISISEAARRAGVDRATIQRKIKDGIISKEIGDSGQPAIDLSELARIYPAVLDGAQTAQGARSDAPQLRAGDSAGLEAEILVLRERCAALERERDALLADKADLRAERDRLLSLAEAGQRLLTDQRSARPGLLARLIGRTK